MDAASPITDGYRVIVAESKNKVLNSTPFYPENRLTRARGRADFGFLRRTLFSIILLYGIIIPVDSYGAAVNLCRSNRRR